MHNLILSPCFVTAWLQKNVAVVRFHVLKNPHYTFLEGADYTDTAATFSLTPTAARECFDVPIIDDTVFELEEYFNASLESDGPLPAGASLGIIEARVRINDNDGRQTDFFLSLNTLCLCYTLSDLALNVFLCNPQLV